MLGCRGLIGEYSRTVWLGEGNKIPTPNGKKWEHEERVARRDGGSSPVTKTKTVDLQLKFLAAPLAQLGKGFVGLPHTQSHPFVQQVSRVKTSWGEKTMFP